MRQFTLSLTALWLIVGVNTLADDPVHQNLNEIPNDLVIPEATASQPAPGQRVWQQLPEYADWKVRHALYLPTDWQQDRKYPVLFEYPGNGGFQNALGDRSDGTVEGCRLGYGLSAGKEMIWVSLPFVDPQTKDHARNWWGDPDQTARYCQAAIDFICQHYGGDPDRLILCGFSRGSIACNYIGLRDDQLAPRWRGFFCHSHYDGVRAWGYADSDRASAKRRLDRLRDRPQFISHERSVEATRNFLSEAAPNARVTYLALPWPNHSADWVLKPVPQRDEARAWLKEVLMPR